MAHIRKQIRDAFAGRLAGLSFNIGDGPVAIAVETERFHAIPQGNLPLVRIAWRSEPIVSRSRDDEQRSLSIDVEAWAKGAPLQDKIDAMSAVIEAAIGADKNLGGLVMSCRLSGTEFAATGDGESRTGLATISFRVDVITSAGDPQTRS